MGQADTHHQLRDARIGAVDCAQWRGEVRAVGTAKRKGTKVFALAGKIRRGALIEVPMGTTIREIVEESVAGSAMRPQKQLVKARAEDRDAARCVYRFLSGQVARRPEKPLSSIMGRLDPGELKSFLRSAHRGGSVSTSDRHAGHTQPEASRCLYCDCRSSGNCVLQHYAQTYGANASRFRAEWREFEQQLQPGGIIF